jgi:hypothetical protein
MARDLKANLHAMGRDSMPSAKRRMNKDNDVVKTNMRPPVNLPPAMPFSRERREPSSSHESEEQYAYGRRPGELWSGTHECRCDKAAIMIQVLRQPFSQSLKYHRIIRAGLCDAEMISCFNARTWVRRYRYLFLLLAWFR